MAESKKTIFEKMQFLTIEENISLLDELKKRIHLQEFAKNSTFFVVVNSTQVIDFYYKVFSILKKSEVWTKNGFDCEIFMIFQQNSKHGQILSELSKSDLVRLSKKITNSASYAPVVCITLDLTITDLLVCNIASNDKSGMETNYEYEPDGAKGFK